MRGAGYCECGCGLITLMGRRGLNRFINGHQMRGPLNGRWKGGERDLGGYVGIWKPGHPQADRYGYVPEHRLVAEDALESGILPEGAVVHHHNEDRADNRPENLVICQDNAYHMLLHQRMRALRASGHASWLKCKYCKQYDDPSMMKVPNIPTRMAHHRECENQYQRERRKEATSCEARP